MGRSLTPVKKGYRELFAAMPRVLAAVPNACVLDHGASDRLRTNLSNGPGGRISKAFASRVPLGRAMRANAINVMALPSHREPCALAYIEAAFGEADRCVPSAGAGVDCRRETGILACGR